MKNTAIIYSYCSYLFKILPSEHSILSSHFNILGETFFAWKAAQKICRDTLNALSELPVSERIWRIFWLIGPFILLIERSPSDAWISIISLGFIVRSLKLKEGRFLKVFWVKAAFFFLGSLPRFSSFFKNSIICLYRGIYLVPVSVICNGMRILARYRQEANLRNAVNYSSGNACYVCHSRC